MKWIFYSLLLANLVYMALNLWGEDISPAENEGGSQVQISGNPEAERILLVSESTQPLGNPAPELEQPTLVDGADTAASCLGLGPFENVISAQDVAERLDTIGYEVEMTAVDTPTGASDFRVVMPPFSSLQEAFRRLREFKSRDIDSYVITQGEDAQGISLGVFSTNEAAQDYQEELAGLGYEVEIKVIPRVNRGYWVQIGPEQFPPLLLEEVMAEFVEVQVTETGCMNE